MMGAGVTSSSSAGKSAEGKGNREGMDADERNEKGQLGPMSNVEILMPILFLCHFTHVLICISQFSPMPHSPYYFIPVKSVEVTFIM